MRGQRAEVPESFRKQFASKQITCGTKRFTQPDNNLDSLLVEYIDLSPGMERDIFQRVQLGMTLTAAGKRCITPPSAAIQTAIRRKTPGYIISVGRVSPSSRTCYPFHSPSNTAGSANLNNATSLLTVDFQRSSSGTPSEAVTFRTSRTWCTVAMALMMSIYQPPRRLRSGSFVSIHPGNNLKPMSTRFWNKFGEFLQTRRLIRDS